MQEQRRDSIFTMPVFYHNPSEKTIKIVENFLVKVKGPEYSLQFKFFVRILQSVSEQVIITI